MMKTKDEVQVSLDRLNDIAGLIDKAQAELQQEIKATTTEGSANFLMSIWRDLYNSRKLIAEYERATQELMPE